VEGAKFVEKNQGWQNTRLNYAHTYKKRNANEHTQKKKPERRASEIGDNAQGGKK